MRRGLLVLVLGRERGLVGLEGREWVNGGEQVR